LGQTDLQFYFNLSSVDINSNTNLITAKLQTPIPKPVKPVKTTSPDVPQPYKALPDKEFTLPLTFKGNSNKYSVTASYSTSQLKGK